MTFFKQNILSFFVALLMLSFLGAPSASAQDQFNSSFNFESSSLPYKWQTSAWNDCGGECNEGIQNRDVFCRDNAGNDAPSEADCAHSARPEQTRPCDLPNCLWVAGSCGTHVHNIAAPDDEIQGRDRVVACPNNMPGTPDEVTYVEERTRSYGGSWTDWALVEIRDSLGGNSECETVQAGQCVYNGNVYNTGYTHLDRVETLIGLGANHHYRRCEPNGTWHFYIVFREESDGT